MQRYWVWLSLLKEIRLRDKRKLLEQYPNPEELHRLGVLPNGKQLNTDLLEAEQVVNTCNRKGIHIISMGDSLYPAGLLKIPDPPVVLYCRGTLPDLESHPTIGVVGTRRATQYGISVTERISRELVCGGGRIVSGGAAGIDTAALWASLREGVPTVAVLGCGVDVTYPTTNRKLFMEIEQNGCLLSEYVPGMQPTRWTFPARNRIISGLSHGTLVIEAPAGSGALITAKDASKHGRPVFVVPGNIDMETCAGSNQLLREGAQPVFSGEDILRFYASRYPGTVRVVPAKKQKKAVCGETKTVTDNKKDIDIPTPKPYIDLAEPPEDLTDGEKKLLSCITTRPETVDTILSRAELPPSEALALLTNLSLQGLIIDHPGRLISRKLR